MRLTTVVWLASLAALAAPRPALAQVPVHWTLAPAPNAKAEPGQPITLVLTATIDEGWHLYAMTEPPGPIALTFALDKSGPFSLAGAITESAPTKKFDPNFNVMTEFHESTATFTLPLTIAAGAPNGPQNFAVTVTYQTCNDRFCLPPKNEKLQVQIDVGSTGSAGSPGSAEPAATTPGPAPPKPEAKAGPPAIGPAPPARAVVPDLAAASRATTLSAYLGLAALMGALSLLTPCVFPMVPITVSYFTNRAGRSRREAVMQALVYGLGIVLTFTAVGFTLAVAFGASGLNRFAANPWLNLGVDRALHRVRAEPVRRVGARAAVAPRHGGVEGRSPARARSPARC